MTKRIKKTKAPKGDHAYKSLWKIVDGAVRDAFIHHQEYLTVAGRDSAQMSIVKRVTGAIKGYAVERNTAKGRSVRNKTAAKKS